MREGVLDQLIPVENPEEELELDADTRRFLEQLDLNQIDLYQTVKDNDFTGQNLLHETQDKAVIGPINGKTKYLIRKAPNTRLKTTNIEPEGNVLYDSDGATITAETIKALRHHRASVLVRSDGAQIDAKTIRSARDVLRNSEDAIIDVKTIKSGFSVLRNSNNAIIRAETIKADNKVIKDSDGASIDAKSISGSYILGDSDGATIDAETIDSEDLVLYGSDGASINAKTIKAGREVLSASNGASIDADTIEVTFNVLSHSNGSYILSDFLKIEGNLLEEDYIGEGSTGSLLASKKIESEKEKINANLEVITKEDREDVLTYTGEWSGLKNYLRDRFEEGLPEALKAFQLEGEYADTVEQVEEEFREIEEMYEAVREEHQIYENVKDLLELEDLEDKSNQERKEQLKNIRETAREKVQQDYDIEDENVDKLLESNQPAYLLEQAEDIKETTDLDIDQFIEEFHNGSDSYVKKSDFEKTRHIDTTGEKQELTEEKEKANKKLYWQGVEILRQMKEGDAGKFQIEDEEYQDKLEELEEISEQINQEFQNGNREKGQSLVEKKKQLEEELEQIGEQYREETLYKEIFRQEDDEDLELSDFEEEYSEDKMEKLKKGFSQLHQEYLKENKVHEEVENIANSIALEADDITANTVKTTVWDKDIQTIPTHDKYQACLFPDGGRKDELPSHIVDKDTQFLKVQAGENQGIAITTQMQDRETDENYLVVNSVNSSSNIFKRQKVTEAVDQAITEYAEQLEIDAVIYNDNPGNQAPKDYLDQLSCERERVNLEKEGYDQEWLETNLGENQLYHKEI